MFKRHVHEGSMVTAMRSEGNDETVKGNERNVTRASRYRSDMQLDRITVQAVQRYPSTLGRCDIQT